MVIPYRGARHLHHLKRILSWVSSENTFLYAIQCDTIQISDDRLETRNRALYIDDHDVKERCLALLPVLGIGGANGFGFITF